MSIGNNEKMLENVRKFAFSRFGSLKELADAMGIKPQNLNTYLQGKVKIGPKFLKRLKNVGFNDNIDDVILQNVIKENSVNIDLAGAIELSNTPASRLAQLVGVSPATFTAWQNGTATPTVEELSRLFNQVVALALSSRHAATTPPPKEEPQKATG
ncbi:MAG: helix-turn-helix transcriptional regulator [Fibrobacter sp.]|uniref:helix-turn-helix domain-containing protein n=1 Tax=Fibrobacter sp. TaxID=35828 RepID=UPI0025BA5CD8|nr:helix-turn-helix transcriptional regulator [Fibrobacter sp.]MBQ7079853.1 helix-turn-helix transcriptional regulator [Fibrobacter sp.]